MYSVQDLHKGGVSPFGNLRINDRSHLPAAYRSVPRPSSPLGAKASTERPSFTRQHRRPHAVPTRKGYPQAHQTARPTGQRISTNSRHPRQTPARSSTQKSATPSKHPTKVPLTPNHLQLLKNTRNRPQPRSPPSQYGPVSRRRRGKGGSKTALAQPPDRNHLPILWLGDGRYRTDDPLLAKQALSH